MPRSEDSTCRRASPGKRGQMSTYSQADCAGEPTPISRRWNAARNPPSREGTGMRGAPARFPSWEGSGVGSFARRSDALENDEFPSAWHVSLPPAQPEDDDGDEHAQTQ
jgi:hypothetical protein